MRMTKIYPIAIAVLTIVALFALPLAAASAGPNPVPKVTGSIGMGWQQASFNAFDFGVASPNDRGSVIWTDYAYPGASDDPITGTGVWNVKDAFTLVFPSGGLEWTHQINVTSRTPLSTSSIAFEGDGVFVPGGGTSGSQTSKIIGKVTGSSVSFNLVYDLSDSDPVTPEPSWPGYSYMSLTGTIGTGGSVTGTATEYLNGVATGNVYNWTMPAGSLYEVYSYTAPVTCAAVDPATRTAAFSYTIPATAPVNQNLGITMSVWDGGNPGAGSDTFGYITGTACDSASVTRLPIVSGNLTVHK